MLIFSQNLENYGFPIPQDAIFRVNLAWVNTLKELEVILEKQKTHKIFLDLPANRTKPPNNKYDINDLVPILKSNSNIKYFAVSNIHSPDNLEIYLNVIPKHVTIVPKIESVEGVVNVKQITDVLGNDKILMLDHDDLYSSVLKSKLPDTKFLECLNNLVDFCNNHNVILLRTIGVVFSDQERKITDYIG